jgi:ubiquinone/menaquinone biosynthesis C-methylase UbiE
MTEWDNIYSQDIYNTLKYKRLWNLTNSLLQPDYTKIDVKERKPILTSNSTVLDLGCAEGKYSIEIANKVKAVYGVDISANKLNKATAKAAELDIRNVIFMKADWEKTTFIDQFFDVVLFSDAIVHAMSIPDVLHEIRRLLKFEGFLVVSAPLKRRGIGNLPLQLHSLSRSDFENLVVLCGFDIVDAIIDRPRYDYPFRKTLDNLRHKIRTNYEIILAKRIQ